MLVKFGHAICERWSCALSSKISLHITTAYGHEIHNISRRFIPHGLVIANVNAVLQANYISTLPCEAKEPPRQIYNVPSSDNVPSPYPKKKPDSLALVTGHLQLWHLIDKNERTSGWFCGMLRWLGAEMGSSVTIFLKLVNLRLSFKPLVSTSPRTYGWQLTQLLSMETLRGIFHRPTPQEQVLHTLPTYSNYHSYKNGKPQSGRKNVY